MSSFATRMGFGISILKKQPINVLIQVTNRCNYKCTFCDFWPNGVHPSQEITVAEYQRISKELKRLGTLLVSIEGGEPFARSDLLDIVRAFSKEHLVVLYTNGWYVTEQNAKKLFEAGLHQVGVSIDFPDAERHDQKRGKVGAFEKAVAAVKAFRDAAPQGGRQVHIMSVMMRENQESIENLLRLSRELEVGHYFTLLSKKGFRRGKDDQDQLPQAPISQTLMDLYKRYPHFRGFQDYIRGIDSFITDGKSGGELNACRAGSQSFNLDHLGNVSTCIEKIDRPVGNIRTASMEELLTKLSDAALSKGCQDCWTLCRSYGQNLGNRGSAQAWIDMFQRLS